MKNKKSQAAMEFLMTYGWAILAAIIVIGILGYYFSDNPVNNQKKICEDLSKENKDGTVSVYPSLLELHKKIENQTGGRINSFTTHGKRNGCSGSVDCENIQCRVLATLCIPSAYEDSYCMDIDVNLIITEEEYTNWKG